MLRAKDHPTRLWRERIDGKPVPVLYPSAHDEMMRMKIDEGRSKVITVVVGHRDDPELVRKQVRIIERWWKTRSRVALREPVKPMTIGELARAYGRDMGVDGIHLRRVIQWMGTAQVEGFGPRRMAEFYETVKSNTPCGRATLARYGRTLVKVLQWGMERELVAVQTVEAARRVRVPEGNGKPRRKTGAVDLGVVRSVLPHIRDETARDMVELMTYTGMRANEVCHMRVGDLETHAGAVVYHPLRHKTSARKHRYIVLGPRALQIIAKHTKGKRADETIFTRPLDGRAGPDNPASQRQGVWTYNKLRYYLDPAISAAGVKPFTLHQIRKGVATEIRREHGLEAARVMLGHSSAVVTDAVYAERDMAKIAEVVARMG